MCFGMDSDLSQFIGDVWRYKPIVVILLVAGLIIFVCSVIDTHRHRKKIKKSGIDNIIDRPKAAAEKKQAVKPFPGFKNSVLSTTFLR